MELEPGADVVTDAEVPTTAAAPGVTGNGGGGDQVGALDIDESVLDAIENDLADVERALALLDEGTYGQCEVCGRTLEDAVLAQAPTTRFCPDHLPLSRPDVP